MYVCIYVCMYLLLILSACVWCLFGFDMCVAVYISVVQLVEVSCMLATWSMHSDALNFPQHSACAWIHMDRHQNTCYSEIDRTLSFGNNPLKLRYNCAEDSLVTFP